MSAIAMSEVEVEVASKTHWFEDGTKRFFSSRIAQLGYHVGNRVYFVSSEQRKAIWMSSGVISPGTPRMYSVNVVDLDTGKVNSPTRPVGDFQTYKSSRAAHAAMQAHIKSLGGDI